MRNEEFDLLELHKGQKLAVQVHNDTMDITVYGVDREKRIIYSLSGRGWRPEDIVFVYKNK